MDYHISHKGAEKHSEKLSKPNQFVMSKEKYLRTDDLTEAIKSLEMVGKLLPDLLHDVYIWKWVIHALHSSFQGFMVAALKGSSGLAVLTKKSEEAWHKAHRDGSRTFPRQKLDTFPNLYKKIKTEKMLMYSRSEKFVSTVEQDWSVRKLNSLRNDFIHFRPMILRIRRGGG